jgi:hypothetical protein
MGTSVRGPADAQLTTARGSVANVRGELLLLLVELLCASRRTRSTQLQRCLTDTPLVLGCLHTPLVCCPSHARRPPRTPPKEQRASCSQV